MIALPLTLVLWALGITLNLLLCGRSSAKELLHQYSFPITLFVLLLTLEGSLWLRS